MSGVVGVLAAAAEVETFCRRMNWRFCFIGGIAVQRWGATWRACWPGSVANSKQTTSGRSLFRCWRSRRILNRWGSWSG